MMDEDYLSYPRKLINPKAEDTGTQARALKLTVEKIRSLCTDKSFRRGAEYFSEGRVHNVQLSSGKVNSVVEGSRSYRVSVKLLHQATDASCTCPYDFEGYCKHIVATLLAVAEDYERMAKEANEEGQRFNSVLESSTEKQLKDFLRREIESDDWLKKYFLIYMTGEEVNGGKSVQDYKKEIAELYGHPSGRRYDRMIEYGNEIDFSPFNDLAQRYVDRKNFIEAAKVYQALSEVIAESMDMVDDSDGYYGGEFDSALEGFASAVNSAGLKHEEKAPYIEYLFKKYIVNDPDYFRENYETALESICTSREDLEYWKRLLSPCIPDSIPSSNRNWERYYESTQLLSMQICILDKLDDQKSREELYDLLGKHYLNDEEFCNLYVRRLRKDGKMEEAARVAEEGVRCFPPHLASELRRFLDRFYEKRNPEKYRENLKSIFFEEREWQYYRKLKEISGSDWSKTLKEIIEHFSSTRNRGIDDADKHTLIGIYLREKMYDDALKEVLRSKSLEMLGQYYKQLSARYPSEYFDAYKQLIIPFVDSRVGRDHYRDVVRELRQMKKINGFESEFNELTRFIKEKHARKPAFQDELKKL